MKMSKRRNLSFLLKFKDTKSFAPSDMQLLQEWISREPNFVSYLVEVDELQQGILAHVEFLLAIPRIAQDTQVRTFRENHIKGFHLEHATSIKSDNGILLFRTDGNGVVHALLRIGMTCLHPSQLFGSRFQVYLSRPVPSIAKRFLPCCLSSASSANLRSPHCPVQSLDIDCNLCHNSLFYVYSCKGTGMVCQIVTQARKLSQKSFVSPCANSPRNSLRKDDSPPSLSPLAITQKISTIATG